MKKIIENIKFIQDGTMVFGDLHLQDGFVERIDYKTPHMSCDIAIPGFIDLHTHGFRSYSCEDHNPRHLLKLSQEYAKRGITSFCATLHAHTLNDYAKIIDTYHKAFQGDIRGAQFRGFHLEGPYLNPERCGAQKRENLCEIHIGELEGFLSTYHDDIKIMTIAPELPHAIEAIQLLTMYGVHVSLGHSNATFEQTKAAFDEGATQVTHLGNTMPSIDHHHEGMMDAIFLSDCSCEIIMDRVHMQKKMLQWVIQLLGVDRVLAISDGTLYSGFEDSDQIVLEKGCHLKDKAIFKDGILQGSCIDMLDIFRYLYKEANYDLMDCISMCSTNAGKILKTYTTDISLGKKINLVILDSELNIKDVIINGRSCI